MQIKTEYIDIASGGQAMRAFVAAPAAPGSYPGIVLFSDIFQLSGPAQRAVARLAGYGFVVAAHEMFHRLEPAGRVLSQDDEGRAQGMRNQLATPIAHFDEDCRAMIRFLQQHPQVVPSRLGSCGFCIGGHLAFRAALQPEIAASVCFYPTWLHNGKLGQGENADSLARAAEAHGPMLIHFGELDPLIPPEGRQLIVDALAAANAPFETRLYPADHGFVRDDRAAYDPESADQAFAATVSHFRRTLSA
ncbi:MAG: dienelactone hydrolase family protein [Blastocatellia bacterium]|nr:dienelactone hydrolase family protein [Blastocatellia bacterium]